MEKRCPNARKGGSLNDPAPNAKKWIKRHERVLLKSRKALERDQGTCLETLKLVKAAGATRLGAKKLVHCAHWRKGGKKGHGRLCGGQTAGQNLLGTKRKKFQRLLVSQSKGPEQGIISEAGAVLPILVDGEKKKGVQKILLATRRKKRVGWAKRKKDLRDSRKKA